MKFKSKSTGEKIMSEAQALNAERIETILSTSDFFHATSTRRMLNPATSHMRTTLNRVSVFTSFSTCS